MLASALIILLKRPIKSFIPPRELKTYSFQLRSSLYYRSTKLLFTIRELVKSQKQHALTCKSSAINTTSYTSIIQQSKHKTTTASIRNTETFNSRKQSLHITFCYERKVVRRLGNQGRRDQ